jgi:hypothetical protein
MTDSLERCDACGSTEVVPAARRNSQLAEFVASKKAEPASPPGPGLFGSIQQIVETARAVPSGDELNDPEVRRHATYHRRIVFVACCFAVFGALVGLLGSLNILSNPRPGATRGVLLAPVMFGAGGFVFGMAMMSLIAPTAFLTGPVGRPWMKMIGTRSPVAARIACAVFWLMVTGPLVAIGILIAMSR